MSRHSDDLRLPGRSPRPGHWRSAYVYPYWKVQVPHPPTGAWIDRQHRFENIDQARAACPPGGRLMRVERDGRRPEEDM